MRPEDRKPSKRVFPLLQNLDLDSVTFSQIEGTGNPISIEDMNEQEMIDLVIVNLARLCVAGEWTGLLEAGGGAYAQTPVISDSNYDTYDISCAAPWGVISKDTDGVDDEPCFYPFIAPKTGTLAGITIGVTSAAGSTNTLQLGLYNADSDTGGPTTLIASCAIDLTSTGSIRQTSFTGTPAVTRDTLYWMGYCRSQAVAATIQTSKQIYCPGPGPTNSTEDMKSHLELQSSDRTLPSTVDETDLQTTNSETPVMLLEW